MEKEEEGIPQLLTLKQTCELLKCHPNTLPKWDAKGILVAVRIGERGDRKYKKQDIMKLIGTNEGTKE